MPLNAPGKWKYFISYQQTSTIAEAMVIAYELGKDDCWLDSGMDNKSEDAMREGVLHSEVFVAVLSPQYFRSMFCQKEMMWALTQEKTIVTCYPMSIPFSTILNEVPTELDMIRQIDAKPLIINDREMLKVGINKIRRASGGSVAAVEEGMANATVSGPPADSAGGKLLIVGGEDGFIYRGWLTSQNYYSEERGGKDIRDGGSCWATSHAWPHMGARWEKISVQGKVGYMLKCVGGEDGFIQQGFLSSSTWYDGSGGGRASAKDKRDDNSYFLSVHKEERCGALFVEEPVPEDKLPSGVSSGFKLMCIGECEGYPFKGYVTAQSWYAGVNQSQCEEKGEFYAASREDGRDKRDGNSYYAQVHGLPHMAAVFAWM